MLQKVAEQTDHDLVLPEMVVEEYLAHYRRDVEDAIKKARDAIDDLRRLPACARRRAAHRDRPPGSGHGELPVAGGVEPAAPGRPPWARRVRVLPRTRDSLSVRPSRGVPERAMPGLLAR